MDADCFKLAESLISPNYVKHSKNAVIRRNNLFKTLLSQQQLPIEGWDDLTIESFLHEIAQMDSNNYIGNIGVGEREGRVYNEIVFRRHFRLSHGIGRSGDIAANQPKAAGSSLILALANSLVLQSFKLAGCTAVNKCTIIPMCTGMTISLVLLALRSLRPKAKYVIWPRIDQQSALKCINTAGFEVVVIDNLFQKDIKATSEKQKKIKEGSIDGLTTNLESIQQNIQKLGAENILCILSTTSCFAPRLPDRIVDISKICKQNRIPHVINNAYGVQSKEIMRQISTSILTGRVDAFVQSTDKNYMVPVGGAIVASGDVKFIEKVAKTYAGRGAMSPALDVLITLLSMGQQGWKSLLEEREKLVTYYRDKVETVAKKYGERLLKCERNPISIAITVDNIKDPQMLGSMLFYRNISGPRVVKKGTKKEVVGITFQGYGSHVNEYPSSYLVMACAIGIKKEYIDTFVTRLDAVMSELCPKK